MRPFRHLLPAALRTPAPTPAFRLRLFSQAAQQPAAYHVPRNTNGSVPVYTDIRNDGTRYLVLIRNVQGDINALAADLATSLFPAGSPEAERMKIQLIRKKHLAVSGGQWKHHITRWLLSKGF